MPNRFFQILFFLLSFHPTANAQDPFPQFGIERYGNTIEEPFHTGGNFRQDAVGRLVMDQYTYDGHQFVKNQLKDTLGKLLAIDEQGGEWYKAPDFEMRYVFEGRHISIDTKPYFKFEVNAVYTQQANVYLITNLGVIQYQNTGTDFNYIKSIPVQGLELLLMHKIQDTLFFKSIGQASYVLESDLGNEIIYQRKNFSNFQNGIFYLPDGRILLRSAAQEIFLNSNDPHFQAISKISDNYIISHLVDRKGRLWISMRGKKEKGLYLVQPHSNDLVHIELGIERTAFIRDIFEDNQGSIWVGTGGQGIVQLYEPQIQVLDKSFGLSSDNIWSISQDREGNIYFSSACNGVDVLSPDGQMDHLFGTGCQEALFHDSKGNFWVNTRGITKIDSKGKLTNYQKDDGLLSRTPRTILEDSQGTIWVGTRKAIHKYTGDKFIPFVVDDIGEFDRVLAMQEYEAGKYILAFGSGKIFLFDGQNFKALQHEGGKVNTIFKDREGRVWVAFSEQGLSIFNEQIGLAEPPFANSPENVKMLQDDMLGNLWGICAGNRIFSFNKSNYLQKASDPQLRYYSIDDGVPLMATNNDIQPSTKLLQDGRIIFPNIYGAILIDPVRKVNVPNSFFTEIVSNEKIENRVIQLQRGQNDVTLQLKPILLSNSREINLQYKSTNEWIDVPKEATITLNNLPHGNNTINFRRAAYGNTWKSIPAISIVVPPLFYQRPLFWLACILGLTGLVLWIIKWRTRLIKDRNAYLKEKVNEQTEALEIEKQQLSKSLEVQKKLTQELNLTQAAKNRMYAQISHEFKSPLQAIKANLSKTDGRLIEDNHKRIAANINNLLDISNEILDLSKAESGKLKAKKNWYNINGIIKEQIDLLRPLADRKNLEIKLQCEVEHYYLHIDISLMQKVISNLLSNAIKFSNPNEEIIISSRSDGNQQRIEVTDSGIGIEDAEIPKLTLPYYQATNNIEGGTGIGLSLVEQILKLHHSQLDIQSKKGQGSTFAFCIPRPDISQAVILRKHHNLTDIDIQLNALTDPQFPIVLAVDDSQDVLYFIDQTLQHKYHILKAKNGKMAMSILEKIEPNAIISDVNMPIMSGMDFLKTVRSITKYKAIPFLFLTGSLSEDTELQGLKAGADFLLQKPIQEEFLVSRLEQMFNMQQNLLAKVKSSFAHQLLPKNMHNDDLFLMKELEKIILENISNNKLRSEDIASLMGLGEKTLRNRVKNISGLTLKKYLRCIRLEKAKLLIEENYGNLGEIATATGFSSLSYFSKAYKAYFEQKQDNI